MKLARALIVAILAIALPLPLLMLPACGHAGGNPGQVVLSCAMDAVADPAIREQILAALAAPNWTQALSGLVGVVPGITSEVIACVLQSLLGKMAADPAKAQQYERARTYLQERGYQVGH